MHVDIDMYDAILRVLLKHGKPGYTSRGHVAHKEEVAPSMAAEAMANDILGDQPLLLELRDQVSRSPTRSQGCRPRPALLYHLAGHIRSCMHVRANEQRTASVPCNAMQCVSVSLYVPEGKVGAVVAHGEGELVG